MCVHHSRLLSTCASEEPINSHTSFPTAEGVTCTSDISQSREGAEMMGVPPNPTENFTTPSGDKQNSSTEGDPLDPPNVAETEVVGSCMFITAQDFQVRETECVCVCVCVCTRTCVCACVRACVCV